MARFSYTARDGNGEPVKGGLEAPTRKEALRQLAARGLRPLKVLEDDIASKAGRGKAASGTLRAPRPQDVLPWLEALSELLASGLSAGESIRLLATRLKDGRRRGLSGAVWAQLKEGRALSAALEDWPQLFDRQIVSLVRAGEATGNLNEVLRRLIRYLKDQCELRKRLVGAFAYPAFVVAVASLLIFIFIFILLPRMQGLLASLGGDLPWSTNLLLAGAHGLLRYGPFAAVGLFALWLAFWRWGKTPEGRRAIDAWWLRLRYVRGWIVPAGVLTFVQTMAVLLENGINTVEAFGLARRSVRNSEMRARLDEARERILEGDTLSKALGRTGYFEDLALDRMVVGESTGKLAPSLRALSSNLAERHARRIDRFVALLANGVLLGTFVFVGFLVYAIVAAVLRVSSSFQF